MSIASRRRVAGFLALAAAAIGGSIAASTAQTPATTQTFSVLHIAAAREAVVATLSNVPLEGILPNLVRELTTAMIMGAPNSVTAINEVVNQVATELAPRRSDLDREVNRLWASQLTEAELREVTAFYNTPTGRKLAQALQIIVPEMEDIALDWESSIARALFDTSVMRLQTRGVTFQTQTISP